MFREWLAENDLSAIGLEGQLFPPYSDRAFWDKVDGSQFIDHAEELADFDWPTILATDYMAFLRLGDRDIMENKHFARRRALCTFFLAELCEGRGRFIDQIINGVMAICEETFWGVSAHYIREHRMIPNALDHYIDLFAGETGAAIAVIRDMMGERLGEAVPEIVERMDYELEARIVKPFLTHDDFWWMGNDGRRVNNWNPWVISNVLTVALLAVKDGETKRRMITKGMSLADNYIKTLPADGGCDEGINYWNVSGGAVFDILFQLYIASAGKIDFFSDPLIYKVGDYACKAYIGEGRVVNLADGPGRVPLPGFGHGMMYNFGKMTGNDRLMGLGYLFRGFQGPVQALRRAVAALVYPAEEARFKPYREALLEDLEVSFVRSAEFYGAIKGGHNAENHNHNDVGSFLLYTADNKPLFIDAGVGVYTRDTFSEKRYQIWTMQSSWHNLPDLNGVAQSAGLNYRSASYAYESGRTVVDFAPAYPAEAGVTQAERTFTVGDEAVTITDVYTFSGEENTIEEHFLLAVEPHKCACGITLGDYVLAVDGDCEVTIEEKDITYDRRLFDNWQQNSVWRLTVTARAGREATLHFTLKRR